MGDKSKIEWTDATWNPVNGCSLASPGCTNCYAMKQAHRFPVRQGLTVKSKGGMVWTGEVRFNEKALLQPLKWKRPRRIFVCAHGDLFHDSVPDEWIDRVVAVMALAPQHTFQVLTKRSARMREYVSNLLAKRRSIFSNSGNSPIGFRTTDLQAAFTQVAEPEDALTYDWKPLPNVWLGVSVEDQTRADERIPDLLVTPAAVRWLSCEPLLGLVDLRNLNTDPSNFQIDALKSLFPMGSPSIDWVVCGGESGPGARPMHPEWARSLRDQCQAAGVPFFFKQWGLNFPTGQTMADGRVWTGTLEGQPTTFKASKAVAGRLLDGVEHNAMPVMAHG